ncbi:hypothetical protein HZC34_04755 [Candidatus Saganbacteria bacterium]|nr:hypothetical protein [Candidatus Saganbacteria bacterium]
MKKLLLLLILTVCFSPKANADYGQISVIAIPSIESYVYIDNMSVGATPFYLDKIESGLHLLQIKNGYDIVFEGEIIIQKNKRFTKTINYSQPKKGIKLIKEDAAIDNNSQFLMHGLGTIGDSSTIEFSAPQTMPKETQALQLATSESLMIISAEPRIKRLIEKEKNRKEHTSNVMIGLGGLMALSGLFSNSNSSGRLLSGGLLYAGLGIWEKSIKSDFELNYEKVLHLIGQTSQDHFKRLTAAEDALAKESERLENSRHNFNNFAMAFGAVLTATGSGAIIGLPIMMFARGDYDKKSDTEKEYDAYLKEKEDAKGGVLNKTVIRE